MRKLLHRGLKSGDPLHRVFVVAPSSQAEIIGTQLAKSRGIFGEVGVWPLGEDTDPDPVVVVKAAREASADTVLYAPANHSDSTWPRRLGWAMEDSDLSLLVSPAIAEIAGPRLAIEPVQGLALVRVEMPRFAGPARTVKRAMDVTGSVLVLAVFALPMLAIAAAIKLTSSGPVFFRQQRVGAGGTMFPVWKFRTMYQGADAERAELRARSESDAAAFKMKRDPRVTGPGRFLRRFSLDELPQLFNVLKGDMSLVGPRPHPLDDVELYDDMATRRLLSKPGMTGLWQVSGRSDLGWKDAVMLDLYYVENWSISLDLIIMLRTAKAVITGKGAY
jgi:exopolysaccharide biosynthesis polyprenyl glycosylphosphotransferase